MAQRFAQSIVSFLLLTTAAHADVQVDFKDDVLATGPEYTLGDVAHVQSSDPDLAERLRAVVLGDTPRPGQLVAVTQFAVSSRLEHALPGTAAQLDWRGRPAVRVRGGGVARDGALLAAAAKRALLDWLRDRHADTEIGIEIVGEPSQFYTPVGDMDITTRLSASARLRSRMSVWVDVHVSGYDVQTVPVWFAVSAYTDVAVANEDLPRHTAVTDAHVVFERRDIAGSTGAPVQGELPGQHRTLRTIRAGEIIDAGALEPVPEVQKGDVIKVLARHGNVALTAAALALGDGNVDDSILVESLSSHASYRVIVSAAGQAKVE